MHDNRILCTDCREYARNGACLAARERRREDVDERYGPSEVDLPRRCEFFLPLGDAEDQRTGRERYPTLWAEYEAKQGVRKGLQRDAAQRGIERARAALA